MTRIFLITGFLGSGKTSFLKNVLGGSLEKVGVLVNEFGKISIDGSLLLQEQMDLIELNNGSIFCSCIKEHFIKSLKDLINKKLNYIFIESSGLADPSNMAQITELISTQVFYPFEYVGSICLIDGLYFEQELNKMVSVERQIKYSQVVLINKTDLIDAIQLQKIIKKVTMINPEANIYNMSFGIIDFQSLVFNQSPKIYQNTTNIENNRPYVIVMRLKTEIKIDIFLEMIHQIKEHFHRIKGIVGKDENRFKIDTVQQKVDINTYSGISTAEQTVVFISAIGVHAVSYIVNAANEWIPDLYELET
ncbi:MAG: hypothetical protein CVV02_02970 [Firmicutes bacterium HGW-Firmicutes-7]|nr:MAG: hypothetical protein CVV02_02970 [Firmicutes bacterium HGW-Firmicutes-7]